MPSRRRDVMLTSSRGAEGLPETTAAQGRSGRLVDATRRMTWRNSDGLGGVSRLGCAGEERTGSGRAVPHLFRRLLSCEARHGVGRETAGRHLNGAGPLSCPSGFSASVFGRWLGVSPVALVLDARDLQRDRVSWSGVSSMHGVYIAFTVALIIYLLIDCKAAQHRPNHDSRGDATDAEPRAQDDDAA